MKRGHKRGFTVVELMIVIVVIGILASILAVMYNAAQTQSRDTKLRDSAQKIVEAIQLFSSNNGHFPIGGAASTVAIGASKECSNGANGWFNVQYTCTLNDTLVASGYLPSSLADGLPTNVNISTTPKSSIQVYKVSTTMAMIFYSLELPSAADTAKFNSELTKCGYNPAGTVSQRDSYGARGGICFDY